MVGITALRERAKVARNVDDARRRSLAEQRKHGLGYGDGAKEVGAKRGLDGVEAAGGRRAVALGGDAGVVDEDVEMTELVVDGLSGSADGGVVGQVDCDELGFDSLGGQFGGGSWPAF